MWSLISHWQLTKLSWSGIHSCLVVHHSYIPLIMLFWSTSLKSKREKKNCKRNLLRKKNSWGKLRFLWHVNLVLQSIRQQHCKLVSSTLTILCHAMLCYPVLSYHISPPILPYHAQPYPILLPNPILCYPNPSHSIPCYPVVSYYILRHHILLWYIFYSTVFYSIPSYPILSYLIIYHPIPSYPILSYLTLSPPILSYSIPSHLILSRPIPSHPIPSHPITSHSIPSHLSYPILS